MIVSVALLPDEGKLRRIKLKGLPDRVLKAPEMEVRIKQGEEMIDATIEMVDGVMVVSPKEVKFEPKDGDVIYCKNSACSYVAIFRNICRVGTAFSRYAVLVDGGVLKIDMEGLFSSDYCNPRPATEEEKKLLFDKLAEKGLTWDAERKELVKLEWKPKDGESYFYPFIDKCKFICGEFAWNNHAVDVLLYNKGWIFKTEQECQEFCDRLNEAINSVKL